ncbi:predicted protein, partial [Nematostella vectensis]
MAAWPSFMVLFFSVCLDALGLDDAKKYPDSIFAASSSESTDGYHPYMARLGAHAHEKSWCASTKSENQWLSVTLSKAYPINGLAVKGNEILDQWTQTIKIEYTDDLIHWYSLRENDQPIFPANQNSTEIISINFKETFLAQKLKIYTYQWKDLGCLKIELFFGCDECSSPLGLESHKSTMGLRSSTSHGHQEANEGRLHNVDRGFSARDPGWDMPVFLEVEIRNARQRT